MNIVRSLSISFHSVVLVILASTLCVACGGGGNKTPVLPGLITATAIVDVNGDGKNDVIMSSQGEGYSSPIVLINNGTGSSFAKHTSSIPIQYKGANGSAVDIQAGDFNHDGKTDLLVATVDVSPSSFYKSGQIQLYLGNGDGTFTDATNNITNGTFTAEWVARVRVIDVNGDGFLDFIVSASGISSGMVYLNDGAGKFAPASLSVNSSGVIAARTTICGSGDFLVGDINNDGKPDLYSTSCSASYINTSTPFAISFTQINTSLSFFGDGLLLDINGDGILDLIGSANISGSPSLTVPVIAALGDGLGRFTINNALLSPQPGLVHGRLFLGADFNGDGKQDVLIVDHGYDANPFPGARNWLLINNGAGVLVDKTATALDLLPGYTHQASIGDLNGDGKPDILLNNSSNCGGSNMTCANEPRFWMNNGNAVFTSYNPTVQ